MGHGSTLYSSLSVSVCLCLCICLFVSLRLRQCHHQICVCIFMTFLVFILLLFCSVFCSMTAVAMGGEFISHSSWPGRTLPSRQDPHNTAQLNNPTRLYLIDCSVCLAKEIWIEISSFMFALYVAWLLVFIHCWAKAWCWMKSRMFNQPEYFVRFQKHLKFQLWWWS